jgi:CheY-like chemotaxis protein
MIEALSPPAGAERRGFPRYPSTLETLCRPTHAAEDESPWPVRVCDVSADGLGLLLDGRYEPARFLEVNLPGLPRAVTAHVVRAGRNVLGDWSLGCALARPLADGELAAVRALPRAPGVLVVDDDDAVRKLLHIGLQMHGFAVWLAADAAEAAEVYRQNRDAIDVVLIDVQMPGEDGPQALARLRAIDPRVRACFLSGDSGQYTADELLAHGAARVLRKPFRVRELAEDLWPVA